LETNYFQTVILYPDNLSIKLLSRIDWNYFQSSKALKSKVLTWHSSSWEPLKRWVPQYKRIKGKSCLQENTRSLLEDKEGKNLPWWSLYGGCKVIWPQCF
jgi:hypothetical protein